MTQRATFLALSSIYLGCMAWVWAGVFAASGFTYIGLFAVFLPSAVFWFSAGWFVLFRRDWRLPIPKFTVPDRLVMGLLAAAALASLSQYIALGEIPLLTAVKSSDYLEIARIRQSINYGSPVFDYLSPLLVKVVYPVLAIAYSKGAGRVWR
jgi:hypothetical protein